MEPTMGLESVVGEIREKGQKEAGAIRQETEREVQKILTAAQEKAAKIKQATNEDVEKQVSHILSQEISAANLVVKRELLNAQKSLLDEVYKSTLANLSGLPESFHREAIAKLVKLAKSEIPAGIVHANTRDTPQLKDVLAKDPSFSSYTPGNPVEIEGGIIVESKDGQLQIDYSYRNFMDIVWEAGLKEASDILFR
jgi:V/A-type H+-transporting ATPase subunit E